MFLLVVVFGQFYLIFSKDGSIPHMTGFPEIIPSHPSPERLKKPQKGEWSYEPERDARNVGLSRAQCDAAFPDLYYEIDRAVEVWQKRKHKISRHDIDISWRNDAAFQVLIEDNQLRILETKNTYQNDGYRKRTLYMLSQLHRALLGAAAAGEGVPDVEFSVTVDDISLIPNTQMDTHSIWAFTRRLVDRDQDRLWLMPDFNFFASSPIGSSYLDMQRRAKLHDKFIVDKIPKAVWRGARWTNAGMRGHLLDLTKDREWADVKETDLKNGTNIMAMDDLCRYMFVVHTEGRSWSGRLKFLLNCDSLPIVHDLDWTTEYYHLFVPDGPDQNYIPVHRDFSDLEEKVAYFLAHPVQAQRVVDNAVNTFRSRYTSPAAEACYWRRLIQGWSEVAFKPEPYKTVAVNTTGRTTEERHLRGITYEEFL